MNTDKPVGAILLAACAVAAAGYSFYSTFLAKPPNTGTPEQRAASWRAVNSFNSANRDREAKKPAAAGNAEARGSKAEDRNALLKGSLR